jgi:hypothetical protein
VAAHEVLRKDGALDVANDIWEKTKDVAENIKDKTEDMIDDVKDEYRDRTH